MKKWTPPAEARLTEYLAERTAREGFSGDDAEELKDDLRCHIHEEAEKGPGDTVGLMMLENLISRLDAGYRPPASPEVKFKLRQENPRGGFWNWAFGVILPLAVLILEVTTSFCGNVFFSPVPTWWHTGWIALVPALNYWLIRGRGGNDLTRGAAAGFALFTALFYALLFLPMLPWAVVGVIFVGLGLLPLSPVLAAIVSARIGLAAGRGSADRARFNAGWRWGALAVALVTVALEGPAFWTRSNLASAVQGGKESEAAVNRLRAFHSERTLLKACYEGNRGMNRSTDISGWVSGFFQNSTVILEDGIITRSNSEAVRDLFFRVTGKAFNSLNPPGLAHVSLPGRRAARFDEFEFDDHLGGDDVAVRLKDLDLAESRFDGHVDAISRIGYGEWTLVFKNSSAQPKEARCQVRLPRDGRISRLTLWVNGEPREAAFSTVSKVKAAYKAIAVVQRRDPVLVNVVGPDTVMLQCFPVPAHGEMKVRIGITAPLTNAGWELPFIVERNFGTTPDLEHSLWLQGGQAFELLGRGKPDAAAKDGDGHSLSVALKGDAFMNPGVSMRTALPEMPPVVWCEDRFAKPEERILIREPVVAARPAAEKLVIVVDGSRSLAVAKEWLANAIGTVDEGSVTLILADDHSQPANAAKLRSHAFTGGRDNEPALREAIRLARGSGSPVVWIHGPQAVGLSQTEALLQLLERGTIRPVIYDVEAVPGPNRLAEAIYRTGCLHRGPSLSDPANDLARFLKDLRTERQELAWHWKRVATGEGLDGKKVWDQLARSWAAAEVGNPQSILTDAARSQLAALYQLVTSFSGAVVLETQQQYVENGLTPADGDATPKIPSVPEPSAGLLVILTTAAALMRRRR